MVFGPKVVMKRQRELRAAPDVDQEILQWDLSPDAATAVQLLGRKRQMPKKKTVTGSSSVLDRLKNRFPGKIFSAGEYTQPWMLRRLPTGIIDLDIALNGGLPAGGPTFFVGKEGTGKNWLANQVMARQQQIFGDECKLAVVSTEMVYDKDFGRKCGLVIPFSDAEIDAENRKLKSYGLPELTDEDIEALKMKVGEFVMAPPQVAEDALEMAAELFASREFNVVVLDSFGSLLTEHDQETDLMDSARVGGAALLNTRFFRKMTSHMGVDENGQPNMTCFIGMNQARANMNRANKYSPELNESGGFALRHARWVSVFLKSSKPKDGAKDVRWKITKQKAGGFEGAEGSYEYELSRCGINYPAHVIEMGVRYGVVKKGGAWFNYGDAKWQGLASASKALRADEQLLEEIRDKVLTEAGIRCNYK